MLTPCAWRHLWVHGTTEIKYINKNQTRLILLGTVMFQFKDTNISSLRIFQMTNIFILKKKSAESIAWPNHDKNFSLFFLINYLVVFPVSPFMCVYQGYWYRTKLCIIIFIPKHSAHRHKNWRKEYCDISFRGNIVWLTVV